MAILNHNVLGKLSGKLGNLVFRQINGKTYVSNRPEKYNSTQSFKAANVRNGFKQIKFIFNYKIGWLDLVKKIEKEYECKIIDNTTEKSMILSVRGDSDDFR